jgi:Na+-driven multidrug efflux pump
VLGLLLFSILKWVSPPILRLILSSDELIHATAEFLKYRSYGLIFVMTGTVFRSFYVGIALPNIIGVYSFLMAGINMLLCYLFIFGKFGLPAMGIAGAGLASTLAEFISGAFLLLYTLFKKSMKEYQLFRFTGWNKELGIRIMDLSLPLIVQNLLSMGSWFIFFIFIEKIGRHELATANIVRAAYMINMTPIWGLSVASNSMVSNIIGQGRKQEVIALLNRILKLTLAITCVTILVNLVAPQEMLSLFSSDSRLVADSLGSLQVVNIAMLFFAFAIVSISAVSGTGATRVALKIEVAAITLYLFYNYIVTFVLRSPVEVLWMSEVIYWFFTGVASYIYMRSLRWQRIVV